MELKVLVLLALVATIQAGPTRIHETSSAETCAKTCTASSKFDYTPGTTYEFQYENEVRSSVQGASEDHSGIHLSAKVLMSFISKCELQMKLADVVLKEHDPETSTMRVSERGFREALERNPVTVSFQDGSVEELCLTGQDPTWVTNIKRGILSVFQNNMQDLRSSQKVRESDVSGHCDAEYTPGEVGWSTMLIKKSKNLLGCEGHQHIQSVMKGTPYKVPSEIQSLPLTKSEHNCEQELSRSNGRLQTATCREQFLFRPFSRDVSGAITHNTQKLTFVRDSRTAAVPGRIAQRVPLTFEHASDAAATMNNVRSLEIKLREVCENTETGVKPDTPRLFTDIVYLMKAIDASDMEAVYGKIKSGALCAQNNARMSKMFLDAIPMAGTASSIRMMSQLITRKIVTGIEADMWLTSLAFVQKPTTDMLREVRPLLTVNEDKAMLGVSSLVHSYCKVNTGCETSLEVMKIISLLENKIKSGCKVTETNFETVLLALRAMGNAGFATRAASTLNACMTIASNPIEIRLSAIEAYRRIPCSADRRQIMRLFLSMDEDSEIRIAAYKTLMDCPSPDTLRQVKIALEREEVNQVGSYVWSHLTNLMESSNPHKQQIRAILETETLKKEFDLDKRKFSRNYEGSIFLEKINTGASIDSDLIWSSKSFIMRSGMLNLTVDMFGQSFNLFEVGGRVEGLEYMLESYFGPNGYFSENDVKDPVEESALKTIRADKVSRINKRFENTIDEPRGNLYMRMFGNELQYMSFRGLDSVLNKNRFNILEMLMSLSKDNDYSFSQSVMFLDSSIIIPTSSGFPLNLTVNGTALIDFKASGRLELTKLRNLDISGTIQPSAVVEISSMMSVDAFVTKSGIKMVSTLSSGSSVQGKMQLSDGKVFNAEWDFPQKKMDIVTMRSAFFTVHRDVEREQRMITENRQAKSVCTGSNMATITGLELCGELQFPNASLVANAPYFPMTGPVTMGITLYKRDTHTGYKFEARSIQTQDENIVRMEFSTPEARTDRHFGFDVSLNKKDSTFDMGFTSPWRTADFKGSVNNQRNLKEVQGKVNVDGSVRYMVQAQVKRATSGDATTYTPNVQIRHTNRQPIEVSGSLTVNPGKLLDGELSMTGLRKDPVLVKASVMNKANRKGLTASLSTQRDKQYSMEARLQSTSYKKKIVYEPTVTIRTPSEEVVAFGGSVTSVFGRQLSVDLVLAKLFVKPVSMKGVVVKTNNNNGDLLNAKMDFSSSTVDLRLRSKFNNKKWKTLAADIDMTYNIRRIARNNVKFVSKIINLSSRTLSQAKGSMSLAVKRNPEYNFKVNGNMNHNYKHSEFDIDVRYGANMKEEKHHLEANAVLDRAMKRWDEANLDFNARLRHPGQNINFMTRVNHRHNSRALSSDILLRANRREISGSISLTNKTTDLTNLEAGVQLSFPGQDISLEQTVVERADNEFASITKAQFGKSNINKIETVWRRPTPSTWTVASTVKLQDSIPIKIEGEVSRKRGDHGVKAQVERGDRRYAASASTQYQADKSLQLSADVEYPGRHVVVNFDGRKADTVYTTRSDIRWNADRDDSQRLTASSRTSVTSLRNIDGSFTLQYPSQTYVMNVKHTGDNKYISHFDFQWKPRKVLSVDSTFSRTDNRVILGTLKISSPFEALRSFDISAVHQDEAKEYTSKLDMEWNPTQILSTTLTLRKPLTLKSLSVALSGKTPWKVVKKFNIELSNKLKDSALAASGKLAWNRQFVQTDISLLNSGTESKTDLSCQMDVKSSFAYMRKGLMTISHTSDGRDFHSNARFKRNRRSYSLLSSMTHVARGWSVSNNGNIVVNTPDTNIKTTWKHRNTPSDIATSASTVWDGQQTSFEYAGQQSLTNGEVQLSSVLKLMAPYKGLRDVTIQANHQHRMGLIDSTFQLSNEGKTMAVFDGKYKRHNSNVDSSLAINMPFLEHEMNMTISSNYGSYPVTGHMEVNISPSIQITADSAYRTDTDGNIETSLTLTSPFIGLEQVTLSGKQVQQRADVLTQAMMHYGSSKSIVLEARHRLDSVKRIQVSFTSPFTEPLTAEAQVQGNRQAFSATAAAEAEPFLSKWSAAASWTSQNGLSGTVRVDTPYPTVRYCRATMESRLIQGNRNSNLQIEYMPRKIVQIESTYNLQDIRNLQAAVKLSTPFSKLSYSAIKFYNRGDMREFSNHLEMEYELGKKITADCSYTTRNGMEGSLAISTPFSEGLTSSFKLSGNLNNFQSHAEMMYKNRVAADLSVNTMKGMKSQLSIQTPFTGYEDIRASVSHNGNIKHFQTNVALSHGADNYIGEAKVETERKLITEISIQTPLEGLSNIKASLVADGNLQDFTSRSTLTVGSNSFVSDLNMRVTPDINVDMSLLSPFTSIPSFRGSLSHQGNIWKCTTHAEMSHAQYGRYAGDMSMDLTDAVALDVSFETPRNGNMKIVFKHEGSLERFTCHAEAIKDERKIAADAKMSINPLTFDAKLSTPVEGFEMIRVNLKHDGKPRSFKSHMEFQRNKDTSEADLSFNMLRKLDADLTIRSPYIQVVKASVDSWGSLSRFNSRVRMSYGRSKKITSSARFQLSPTLTGNFEVRTPFEKLKRQELLFKHVSGNQGFTCNLQYNCNGRMYQGDATLQNTDGLKGEVNIKGHSSDPINFKLSHSGSRRQFHSAAELTYGASQQIQGDLNFDMTQNIMGTMEFSSPFSIMRKVNVVASSTVLDNSYNTRGEIDFNGQRGQIDISLDRTRGISASAVIATPFRGFEDITGSIKHSSSEGSFTSEARGTMNGQNIEGRMAVTTGQTLSASASLRSSVKAISSVDISMRHGGIAKKFNSNLELTVGDNKSEADIAFDITDSSQGSLRLKLPKTEEISLGFDRVGKLNDNRAQAHLSVGRTKKFKIIVINNAKTHSLTINTPYENFETTELSVRTQGSLRNFQCHVEASVMRQKGEAELAFTTDPNIECRFNVKTTLSEEINMLITYTGNLMNFRSLSDFSYGQTSLLHQETSVHLQAPISAETTVSSSIFGNAHMAITHEGWRKDFKTHFEAAFNKITGSLDASLTLDANIAANLVIKAPIVSEFRANFEHKDSRSILDVATLKQQLLHVDALVNLESDKTVELRVHTPLNGFRNLGANIRHSANGLSTTSHVDMSVESKRMEADISLTALKGTMSIKTPFTEDVTGSISFKGTLLTSVSTCDLSYGRNKLFDITVDYNVKSSPFHGEITLLLPVNGYESTAVSFRHEYQSASFASHAECTIAGRKSEGDITWRSRPGYEGTVNIISPMMDPIQAKVSFTGEESDYQSHAEFDLGGGRNALDVTLRLRTPVEGSVSIRTPFAENMDMKFSIDLLPRGFQSHGELSMGTSKHQVDASFNLDRNQMVNVAIASPLTSAITLTVGAEGRFPNAKYTGILDYGGVRKVDLTGSLSYQPSRIGGHLSLRSPAMNDVSLVVDLTGSFRRFTGHGELDVMNLHSELDASLDTVNKLSGNLRLKAPVLNTMSVSFEQTGSLENFNIHAEAVRGNTNNVAEATFNMENGVHATLSLKSPAIETVDASFRYIGPLTSFRATSQVSYGSVVVYHAESTFSTRPYKGSIRITTPYKGLKSMSAEFSHDGTPLNFRSHAETQIGQHRAEGDLVLNAASALKGTISLKSSLFKNLGAGFDFTGELGNFKSHSEFAYGTDRYTTDASLAADSGLQGSLSIKTPNIYELGADLKISSAPGNFKVNAEGKYQGRIISGEAEVGSVNGYMAMIKLKTPFSGFETMDSSVKYEKGYRSYLAHGEFDMPLTGKVEIDGTLNTRRGISGELTLKSPFQGWRQSSATFRHQGDFPVITSTATLRHANVQYGINADINGLTSANIAVTTPIPLYENLSFGYSVTGPMRRMQGNARLVYGNNKDMSLTLENALSENKLETKASLTTPFTDELKMELDLEGSLQNFRSAISFTLGHDYDIKLDTLSKFVYPSFNMESTLATTLKGRSDTHKMAYLYESENSKVKTMAYLKVFSREMTYTSSIQTTPSIEATFTLKTPFIHFEDLALSVEHSRRTNRFTSKSAFRYGTKKIEGNVSFLKYDWRRIQTSLTVSTPFQGFENTRLSYRHSGFTDGFVCSSSITALGKDLSGTFKGSRQPLGASLVIKTPFTAYEELRAETKFDSSYPKYSAEANILYQAGKEVRLSSEIDMTSVERSAVVKLTTPFRGYETSEISITQSGDIRIGSQSRINLLLPSKSPIQMEANVRMSSLRDMDYSFSFTSSLKNLESARLSFVNRIDPSRVTTRFETSLAGSNTALLDSNFERRRNVLLHTLSLTTPFDSIRALHSNFALRNSNAGPTQHTMTVRYNGKPVLDYDSEWSFQDPLSGSIDMKSPRPMKGTFKTTRKLTQTDIFVNWNTERSDSNLRLESSYEERKPTLGLKMTCPKYGVYGIKATLSRMPSSFNNNVNVYWGRDTLTHVGYDLVKNSNDASVKLLMPDRSLQFIGMRSARTTEGSFLWDADRDETKKIGFRSTIAPTDDSMKADITVMMPSMGKDMRVDSEMVLNRGRLLFEGKAEFSYSTDERKKFSISSRLEDVSNDWHSKNYSFSLGVSHPYTSIGMQVASHVSNSNDRLSAGVDVEYLTVRRQTKSFNMNGEINKLRKSVAFDMSSPVKKISINGNAKFDAPFRMSLENKYDDRRPLSTAFTLDPQRRLMDFNINYDLDNPTSEFHVSTRYSSSSEVVAEVYHVVYREKVSDALFSVRLNNSHLLHNRIHWRPRMLEDLRTHGIKKANIYSSRFNSELEMVRRAVAEEVGQKSQLVGSEVFQELEPVTIQLLEQMETLVAMYESNRYHTRDIVDALTRFTLAAEQDVLSLYNSLAVHGMVLEEKVMERMVLVQNRLRRGLSVTLEEMKRYNTAIYNIYQAARRNVTEHPAVRGLKQTYTKYMNSLPNYSYNDHVTKMADRFTSAIYNTRELINANLPPMDNVVLQQGRNAYKYWELRENAEMVARAIYNYIKLEIDEEFAGIREAVERFKKSTVTIYDPAHGEIQLDLFLPIPITSLEVLPSFDVNVVSRRLQKYIPRVSLALPSSDVSTWLPPFQAVATVKNGRTVTTFDGRQYELDGSCTYQLAKDFVDQNFSISLKNGNTRTLNIFVDGEAIEIFRDGQIRVNGEMRTAPVFLNSSTITNQTGIVRVDGAGSFSVEFNSDLDLYTIKLSGWYFGKTAGLLGTYDNEPSNDLTTSYGRQISSADRFARTWDIGTARCR